MTSTIWMSYACLVLARHHAVRRGMTRDHRRASDIIVRDRDSSERSTFHADVLSFLEEAGLSVMRARGVDGGGRYLPLLDRLAILRQGC
jgi:hypothetical protein